MYNDEVKSAIEAEFALASKARAEGFEGRARVCARRAVGIAFRDYARIHHIPVTGTNAYDLLLFIRHYQSFSPDIRRAADHLSIRVDEEFKLPPGIDLLTEARWLVDTLLNESN